jgi:proline iminopeptidase
VHGLVVAVLLVGDVAGGLDLVRPPGALAEFAGLFPSARFVVQSGAGHYPWLDNADRFAATVTAFLDNRL